jgi:hypothetical protein
MKRNEIDKLAKALDKFGRVVDVTEHQGRLTILITEGFKNNMPNVAKCQEAINGILTDFPYIHKQQVDEGLFYLVLKN